MIEGFPVPLLMAPVDASLPPATPDDWSFADELVEVESEIKTPIAIQPDLFDPVQVEIQPPPPQVQKGFVSIDFEPVAEHPEQPKPRSIMSERPPVIAEAEEQSVPRDASWSSALPPIPLPEKELEPAQIEAELEPIEIEFEPFAPITREQLVVPEPKIPAAPKPIVEPMPELDLGELKQEATFGRDRAQVIIGEGKERIAVTIAADLHRVHVTATTPSEAIAALLRNTTKELDIALREHGMELGTMTSNQDHKKDERRERRRPNQRRTWA